jgi:UDP-3-O-[3-hydroxymyristoyl] glucosamine N-acyltransferase
MAGQAGVADNLSIGDGAVLGAQAGVGRDIPAKAVMSGSPAMDAPLFLRAGLALAKLPELLQRVRRLEKEVARLSGQGEQGGQDG